MKHTTQKGTIAQLAIIMIVSLVSITQGIYAASRQQLPQGQKDTGKISIQDSKNVVTDGITAGGDVIIGGSKVTNIYGFIDYQKLLEQIKELEQDLRDIPPDKVERRLEKSKKLEELRKQKQDFEQQIIRLAETFSKIEINTERLKQAQQYFTQGKFREADAILKTEELSRDQQQLLDAKARKTRELEELNKQLISNASEFLIKAQITATNFSNPRRFQDACSFYEKSIQSYPTFENTWEYAYFLQQHNQHNEAERYYQEVIKRFGSELDDPTRAATLNNLGVLQKDKNEFDDALKSYKEALEIRKKLALANPQTYLPYVATTLNNLGNLQSDKNEFDDALKSYKEALEIYRKLALANPQTYLPDVATTLNNLGNLQSDKNEFDDALKSYKEALEIRKKLALANPQTYLPYVATTLNNLGNLQSDKNEFDDALKSYKEALEIYRKLALANPQTYLPDVAMTLINLSILYQKSRPDKEVSVQFAMEALTIVIPFLEKAPYTQQYALRALQVLRNWGVDIEKILAEEDK
ncbi:MAG: tetratricopeptide repeat protein [Candidatus Brocadia sp.]|nr:MAG: tetratricopeptide repeat protein [Candidatus Brocadia sp.]